MIGTSPVSGDSYSWVSIPAGFNSTRAGASPAPTVTTTYILTETDTATGCSKTDSVVITVHHLPPTPKITLLGDTLISSAKTGNQWLLNDTIIKGATGQKYAAAGSGKYGVIVTDSNGCTASFDSVFTIVNTGVDKSTNGNLQVNIYPNPFTNSVNIDATLNTNGRVNITIYDMTGRVVVEQSGERDFVYTFDAAQYGGNNSMFIVKITAGNEVVEREIVRMKN